MAALQFKPVEPSANTLLAWYASSMLFPFRLVGRAQNALNLLSPRVLHSRNGAVPILYITRTPCAQLNEPPPQEETSGRSLEVVGRPLFGRVRFG